MRFLVCTLFCLSLISPGSAADQHLATSADPATGQLLLSFGDRSIHVNLAAPGVEFEKDRNGFLKTLRFRHVSTLYIVKLHPQELPGKERVQTVHSLAFHQSMQTLVGVSEEYDRQGNLLSQTHWFEGKLDGPQKIFDHNGVLREERRFEAGLPVGTWALYYEDGTKSTEITFPEDKSAWEATAARETAGGAASVFALPIRSPFTSSEVWFNQKGSKQRERTLSMYLDGGRVVVDTLGKEVYFDHSGAAIREITREPYAKKDHQVLDIGGLELHTHVEWIGKLPFNTSSYLLDVER